MTSITIKEYLAVEGSPFSNKDARIIGPVLHEMGQERGVTARDVVDVARSDNSPLHQYFDWIDEKAADLWRLEQARKMMRSILIKYEEKDAEGKVGETRETRAFQITRTQAWEPSRESRTYRSFKVLHGDSAFAVKMMEQSFEDLLSWRRKYAPYVSVWTRFGDAFQEVVNQIDEFSEDIVSGDVSNKTDDALAKLLSWRDEYKRALDGWIACRDQMKFMIEAIDNTEEVFVAAFKGKLRDCLKCDKSFYSTSASHRICDSCHGTKTYLEHQSSNYEAI